MYQACTRHQSQLLSLSSRVHNTYTWFKKIYPGSLQSTLEVMIYMQVACKSADSDLINAQAVAGNTIRFNKIRVDKIAKDVAIQPVGSCHLPPEKNTLAKVRPVWSQL